MKTTNRIEYEKSIISKMIRLYCRKNHPSQIPSKSLCDDCNTLWMYSAQRTDACPNTQSKSFCSVCTTPCYGEDYRRDIRKVMRFSGPRMIFYHPLFLLKHLVYNNISKKFNTDVKEKES